MRSTSVTRNTPIDATSQGKRCFHSRLKQDSPRPGLASIQHSLAPSLLQSKLARRGISTPTDSSTFSHAIDRLLDLFSNVMVSALIFISGGRAKDILMLESARGGFNGMVVFTQEAKISWCSSIRQPSQDVPFNSSHRSKS
ncbi:hypothetical protein FRC02_000179 [Tulasnella sp. 418]|nr:hypothetical protein FRC02_000179 [Tulasnella sp. 418]